MIAAIAICWSLALLIFAFLGIRAMYALHQEELALSTVEYSRWDLGHD